MELGMTVRLSVTSHPFNSKWHAHMHALSHTHTHTHTLHYTTLYCFKLHCTKLRYLTPHYITFTTLHYTTLQFITCTHSYMHTPLSLSHLSLQCARTGITNGTPKGILVLSGAL
jgi:hypothetical protein